MWNHKRGGRNDHPIGIRQTVELNLHRLSTHLQALLGLTCQLLWILNLIFIRDTIKFLLGLNSGEQYNQQDETRFWYKREMLSLSTYFILRSKTWFLISTHHVGLPTRVWKKKELSSECVIKIWSSVSCRLGRLSHFLAWGFLALPFNACCKTCQLIAWQTPRNELCQSISLQVRKLQLKVYLQCTDMEEPIPKQR